VEVQAFDRVEQRRVKLTHADCGFTYRSSIFNTIHKNRFIVLSVTYSLLPGGAPAIRYPDVRCKFETVAHSPTLAEVRSAVRDIRATKAMLLAGGDRDS